MAVDVRPIFGLLLGVGSVLAVAGAVCAVKKRRTGRTSIRGLAKPSVHDIAKQLRESIERQVDTTHSGRILKACDKGAVDNLVTNIVGNLANGVDLMIDESIEEHGGKLGAVIDDEDDDDSDWGEPEWMKRIDAKRRKALDEIKAALKQSPALIATYGGGEHLLITSGEMQEGHRGKFRVTTFGDDGPIGHAVEESMEKVAEEIRSNGYKALRPATDDDVMTWTSTPKFVEGSKRVAATQALNTLHFRAKDRDAARAVEEHANRLAAEGKWDEATLVLQQGIKDLGRATRRLPR